MLDRREQLGIEPGQPGQLFGVDLVGLASLPVDEAHLPGVGEQSYLVLCCALPSNALSSLTAKAKSIDLSEIMDQVARGSF